MKLRHKASGEIWEVEHFVARDAATGGKRVIDYLKGYELIPDDLPTPQQSPHVEDLIASNTRAIDCNTKSIENLTSFGENILKRVKDLESERTLVAEVIQSHGVELEEGLKMDSDILKRVESIELEYAKAKSWINTLISDNKRIEDRLNTIERQTQGEP